MKTQSTIKFGVVGTTAVAPEWNPGRSFLGRVTSAVLASAVLWAAALSALAQPVITSQPTNVYPSVSLGGHQALRVGASGTPTPAFQWVKDAATLSGQTNSLLNFPSVQLTNLGLYTVVVTNAGASVTSNPVRLDVDPAFTKVTTGAIVTDKGDGWGGAWGDYDNDGFIDLVVAENGFTFLYRNNGDGTFAKITNSPIVTEVGNSAPAWGDYDNDGALDLFMAEYSGYKHRLYHNNGDGTFTKLTTATPAQDGGSGVCAAWGDYDNDGFLDLAVANSSAANALYRNNGDGTFTKMTTSQVGIMAADLGFVESCGWADYDDDGHLDMLFVAWEDPNNPNGYPNVLVHNNGNGTFSKVTNTPIGALAATSQGYAWGDFFNTGRLDLFIANGGNYDYEDDFFYRNDGNGIFTRLSANQVGDLVADHSMGAGCAAADYDNDGYLDLFVTNPGGQGNLLYHNNGNGTFSRVTTGSLVHDSATSVGCAWGDYDNDGFMDLYVANGGLPYSNMQAGFLYRNSGNTNHWLKLKLVGTTSNRSAIGAKVRLLATIRGQTFWQRRDVSGGGWGQDDPRPNFGLGDATNAETVRIEWPSGIVQELHNVAANQRPFLTVTEPAKLSMPRAGELHIQCWKNMVFDVLTSTNLVDWTRQATLTNLNLTGGIQWTDPAAPGQSARFYRAVNQ